VVRMGDEQRRNRRRYVLQGARIGGSDGVPAESCWILDISASGARLQVNSAETTPDQFSLILSHDGRLRRQCLVVWRSNKTIGVQFLPSVTKKAALLPAKNVAQKL
jgi:hypothetical protein